MNRSVELKIDPSILTEAARLGVGGDVRARVLRMVQRSAPLTHPRGNRRFENFVIRVTGDTITDISHIE